MQRVIAGAIVFSAVVSLFCSGVEGRPQYRAEFGKKYSASLLGQKLTCGVCHFDDGKDKTKRNNYGKAVEKHLGAKNVKAPNAIDAAFDKAGLDPSLEKDKTFGDRIKAGLLPAEPELK